VENLTDSSKQASKSQAMNSRYSYMYFYLIVKGVIN